MKQKEKMLNLLEEEIKKTGMPLTENEKHNSLFIILSTVFAALIMFLAFYLAF